MDLSFDSFPIDELRDFVGSNPAMLEGDRNRLKAALRDHFADQPLQLSLLISAVDSDAPTALRSAEAQGFLRINLRRMPDTLASAHGLSEQSARWVVAAWAYSLGLCDEQYYRNSTAEVTAAAAVTDRDTAGLPQELAPGDEPTAVVPPGVVEGAKTPANSRGNSAKWIGLGAAIAGLAIALGLIGYALAGGGHKKPVGSPKATATKTHPQATHTKPPATATPTPTMISTATATPTATTGSGNPASQALLSNLACSPDSCYINLDGDSIDSGTNSQSGDSLGYAGECTSSTSGESGYCFTPVGSAKMSAIIPQSAPLTQAQCDTQIRKNSPPAEGDFDPPANSQICVRTVNNNIARLTVSTFDSNGGRITMTNKVWPTGSPLPSNQLPPAKNPTTVQGLTCSPDSCYIDLDGAEMDGASQQSSDSLQYASECTSSATNESGYCITTVGSERLTGVISNAGTLTEDECATLTRINSAPTEGDFNPGPGDQMCIVTNDNNLALLSVTSFAATGGRITMNETIWPTSGPLAPTPTPPTGSPTVSTGLSCYADNCNINLDSGGTDTSSSPEAGDSLTFSSECTSSATDDSGDCLTPVGSTKLTGIIMSATPLTKAQCAGLLRTNSAPTEGDFNPGGGNQICVQTVNNGIALMTVTAFNPSSGRIKFSDSVWGG